MNVHAYNKKAVTVANIIGGMGFLVGLLSAVVFHIQVLETMGFIIAGTTAVYFSRELAKERVAKARVNYIFARSMYLLVGFVFVVVGLVWSFH